MSDDDVAITDVDCTPRPRRTEPLPEAPNAGMQSVTLRLSLDEAMSVLCALNVVGMLRNTLAPVTDEQLKFGAMELALAERVLGAIACQHPISSNGACLDCGAITEPR